MQHVRIKFRTSKDGEQNVLVDPPELKRLITEKTVDTSAYFWDEQSHEWRRIWDSDEMLRAHFGTTKDAVGRRNNIQGAIALVVLAALLLGGGYFAFAKYEKYERSLRYEAGNAKIAEIYSGDLKYRYEGYTDGAVLRTEGCLADSTSEFCRTYGEYLQSVLQGLSGLPRQYRLEGIEYGKAGRIPPNVP